MKRKILMVLSAICLAFMLTSCAEKVELAGLALESAPMTLTPGQSAAVELVPSFSKDAPTEEEIATALQQVTLVWGSSDEAVATVDEVGAVTAHAPGDAVITVADSEGRYSADIAVTVVVPVEEVTAPEEMTLDVLAGEPGHLVVDILPAEATHVEISYASSDEAVVTVSADGSMTPVAEGAAVITTTVTGDGATGRTEQVLTTQITVKTIPQGIGLESTEGILYVGYSFPLQPYSLPEGAPESTYTFASGDTTVATVDGVGNMKAVAPGTAVITITSAEGHTQVYTLTVVAAPQQSSGSGRSSGGNGGTGSTGGSGSAGGTGSTGSTGSVGGGNTSGNTGGGAAPAPGGSTDGGNGSSGNSSDPWGGAGGDGSPEHPYDSGAGGTPDDGQTINGWE